MNVLIYGAQGYAMGACQAIRELYPQRNILGFLVTSREHNAEYLMNLPVYEIGTLSKSLSESMRKDVQILIATPENVQPEIEETLKSFGYCNYTRLTSKRWNTMAAYFHTRREDFLPLDALPAGNAKPFIRLYMAKSHFDTPLKNIYRSPEYVYPLQVGSALTAQKLSTIRDNTGSSISERNGNYCELTGLYWIWKNKLSGNIHHDQYFGLEQYRRIFDFTEEDLCKLVDNEVDAILPFPLPYEPSMEEHHKRYLKNEDWNTAINALIHVHPEYEKDLKEIFSQPYMYNYNMILAKGSVLRDYCEWLFPVLDEIGKTSVPGLNNRKDRYLGYIGETFETIYFLRNKKNLNLLHKGCSFLV